MPDDHIHAALGKEWYQWMVLYLLFYKHTPTMQVATLGIFQGSIHIFAVAHTEKLLLVYFTAKLAGNTYGAAIIMCCFPNLHWCSYTICCFLGTSFFCLVFGCLLDIDSRLFILS